MSEEICLNECTPKQAAERLHYWQRGGTSFSCQLYSLIQKADLENRARLYVAFPVSFEIWKEWHDSDPVSEFWEKYGLEEP